MARKKGSGLQTIALRNNNTGQLKNFAPGGATAATLGTNLMMKPKRAKSSLERTPPTFPQIEVGGRHSPYLAMMLDPVHAEPALPPVSLPMRAIPLKQYQERLLSTDANGQAAIEINPTMANQNNVVATWSGTTVATYLTGNNNVEYTSFANNFMHYVPLCYEVVLKYTGSSNVVSGRMYGIVGAGGRNPLVDLTTFPLEPNGCEEVTSDGISCTWYSTEPVWSNPCLATSITNPTEWMDCTTVCGIIGGPPSVTNLITVGIYLHLAAIPKNGICGLTPQAALPDIGAQTVAALMQASTAGVGVSATSIKRREAQHKRKALIKDAVKFGGKVVGTVAPYLGLAADVSEALAMMLV